MLKEILYVFTKEYKKEIAYREFMQKHKATFKLNDNAEPLENIIARLQKENFVSNFEMR